MNEEEVKKAIDDWTGDQSISLEECLERAEELSAHLEGTIMALKDDIGR
jgi:hypothetical protein